MYLVFSLNIILSGFKVICIYVCSFQAHNTNKEVQKIMNIVILKNVQFELFSSAFIRVSIFLAMLVGAKT